MMVDRRVMDIGELKALLASSDVLTFKGRDLRLEKGVLRRYMLKMTGISNSQLTRLITQFRRSGHVRVRPYKRHSFPTKYTREDQLLLAELDNNNERLSGKATVAIFK